MGNMDKGLTVPKWVLIVWQKMPQSPKVLDLNEKRASLGLLQKGHSDIN